VANDYGQTGIFVANVSVLTPAPEPSTLVISGLGMVGLFAYARNRQRIAA